jgi:hypothetical protein
MKSEMKGVVHGRTIELEREPGLPDGQIVTVTLELSTAAKSPVSEKARAALMRAAGAWADDADELDKYLEWNREQRKRGRPEIEP